MDKFGQIIKHIIIGQKLKNIILNHDIYSFDLRFNIILTSKTPKEMYILPKIFSALKQSGLKCTIPYNYDSRSLIYSTKSTKMYDRNTKSEERILVPNYGCLHHSVSDVVLFNTLNLSDNPNFAQFNQWFNGIIIASAYQTNMFDIFANNDTKGQFKYPSKCSFVFFALETDLSLLPVRKIIPTFKISNLELKYGHEIDTKEINENMEIVKSNYENVKNGEIKDIKFTEEVILESEKYQYPLSMYLLKLEAHHLFETEIKKPIPLIQNLDYSRSLIASFL